MTDLPPLDDKDKPIDPGLLFKVLKHTKGSFAAAAKFLNEGGYAYVTSYGIRKEVKQNPILNAYFGKTSPIVHENDPDLELLNKNMLADIPEEEAAARQASLMASHDKLLQVKGLQGVGFNASEIQKLESYAQFVGHGFRNTLDITHGLIVVTAFRMSERAAEIAEKILDCEDDADHVGITKDGKTFTYQAPKYSTEDKLKWQEQYTALMDQIRKVSDTAHRSAQVRLNALKEEREQNQQGDGSPRPTKRLKERPNG
jgi:hypothetical protein